MENAETWLESFETVFGAMVFFGVAFEVFIAVKNPLYGSPLERWGSSVADTFVAFGVLGEVVASSRGKRIQGELTRRSNEELAEATKVAGKAIERAASAELQAAEARERTAEVEKLTAWRRLSAEQQEAIADALLATGVPLAYIIEWQNGDPEAHTLARDIGYAIGAANPKASSFVSTSHIGFTLFDAFVALSIELKSDAVLAAFEAAGIRLFLGEGFKPSDKGKIGDWVPNIYCWIGPKQPPMPMLTISDDPNARKPPIPR